MKDFLSSRGVVCKDVLPATRDMRGQRLNISPKKKALEHYRGFNTLSMVSVPAAREDGWYNPSSELFEKYAREVMWYIDWSIEMLQKEKPNYIVIEGGLTHFSRTCVEVARNLDIGVIAIENSFIKDKIFIEFETGCVCNRFSFARTAKDWLECRYLTETMSREVDTWVDSIFKNGLKFGGVGETYNIKEGRKTIFVPLQVWHDQVVLYDTEYDNEEFIKSIFRLATHRLQDFDFILKCHPKEEKVDWQRNTGNWLMSQDIPKNVTVLRNGAYNTQDLIRKCDAVIVNNSQTGLEACLLGKPTVVLGDAYYADKGFTIDVDSVLDIDRDDWYGMVSNPGSYTDIEKVKLFFWYFYRTMYNKTLAKRDRDRISRKLNL